MSTHPLMATFRPQADQRGYCVDIDGEVEFDATWALLSRTPEEICNFRCYNEDSDRLAIDSNLPAWQEHTGPFEVDVELDEWLEEQGVEDGRRGISNFHLERLRKLFDWKPELPMREVEYFRCWPGNQGDSGVWDTGFIEIPANTPDSKLHQAVQAAADKVEWTDEPPCFVGFYAESEPLDDEEE